MKYIKLFENHNSDDEDIEYILSDYYHNGKVEIVNNKYFKIYEFGNINNFNNAIKELDSHKLEYKSASINKYYYIITNLDIVVIDYLLP